MIIGALAWVAVALSGVVLAHALWWFLLAAIALLPPRRRTQHDVRSSDGMMVIVPAHNEEAALPSTLRSLLSQQSEPPRILVVADNCTDRTRAVAEGFGVEVLERVDPEHRGKGYALSFAVAHLASSGEAPQVVVFVDADCTISAGFLAQFDRAFARPGVLAAQAYYEPEVGTTNLGRLRRIAFALLHFARPLGARRLGLPTTAKGTGMAMRWELARRVFVTPSSSLAEDAAITLTCARAGATFEFLPHARVTGYMGQQYHDASVQDARWERGRLSLIVTAVAVAGHALVRGRIRAAAAALEVASLPMSLLVLVWIGVTTLAVVGIGSLTVCAVAAAAIAGYVVVGSLAARVSAREAVALLTAPWFLGYKAGIYAGALTQRRVAWTRTRRPD